MAGKDLVANALAARESAIKYLLSQREEIDRQLQTLGYGRFENCTLAEITGALLETHGSLHGKEIERQAVLGGYTGSTGNFQNYLATALQRAGGFENTGDNNWILNENIAPEARTRSPRNPTMAEKDAARVARRAARAAKAATARP